jgi:2-polyprenyl-6-methoxyphenol hydroxylase-like FAD-dependent oxidoreductase
VHVNFSGIPSIYNFILILAQSETERLLEEQITRRSQAVERLTELVSLADAGSHVDATVRHGDGREERIAADFVVGCDGAHSTVRHEAGIPFAGRAYTGDFVLGDVTLRWGLSCEAAQIFLSRGGILASLPMKGEPGHYRLILISEARVEPGADRDDLSPDEFCKVLKPLAPVDISISNYTWLTRFRLHHRMAQRFQSGRLFLAGDAGHIHSPVGAQGMNTGIQDALSLASKLAAVLRHGAPVGLLSDYEKERLPVARAVVRGTDLAFRLASNANRGLSGWLRETIGPRVIGSSFFQKRAGRGVSQVDVARRDIAIRARLAQRIASGAFKRDG